MHVLLFARRRSHSILRAMPFLVAALWSMAVVQTSARAAEAVGEGKVTIQSAIACTISIPALHVSTEKPVDKLQLDHVPAGTYTGKFSGFNREVSHTFVVTAGETTRLRVNLAQGSVTEGAAAPAPASSADKARPSDPFAAPTYEVPELGLVLVAVKPGTFVMGAEGTAKNETPATRVTISRRYWLGRTEVTQAQWMALMDANPSPEQAADLPVSGVTWADALTYCQLLTQHERQAGHLPEGFFYILPLQAQWEYASRAGGDGSREDELAAQGWYEANSGGKIHPVGRRPANAWGFQDMRGNVAEWCFDWMAPYPGYPQVDFAGPGEGTQRVVRGGAYDFPAFTCRAAARLGALPDKGHPNVGFRIALMSLPPSTGSTGSAGK